MTIFPGAIYTADGRRIDRKGKDLTPFRLHTYQHSAVVSRLRPFVVIGEDLGIEVARVWVLDDITEFEEIPSGIADKTLRYIRGGALLLLLSNRASVVRDIREMMLASMLIAEDMTRRANREGSSR